MQSRILNANNKQHLEMAAAQLINGKVCAIPTETVYGLAAKFDSEEAIKNIFKIKGRPSNNPLILHVSSWEMLLSVVDMQKDLEKDVFELFRNFCPGPLTFVLPAKSNVPKVITANQNRVAVRFPNHDCACKLIDMVGVPFAAPSANLSNHVSPTTAKHVYSDFPEASFFILDGGNCQIGLESTIIEIEPSLKILRPGAIGYSELRKVLNSQKMQKETENNLSDVTVPGSFKKHYAIGCRTFVTPLAFFESSKFRELTKIFSVSAIDFGQELTSFRNDLKLCIDMSQSGNLEEASRNYYDALRTIEESGLPDILLLPQLEHWHQQKQCSLFLALQERILKSASGKFADLL